MYRLLIHAEVEVTALRTFARRSQAIVREPATRMAAETMAHQEEQNLPTLAGTCSVTEEQLFMRRSTEPLFACLNLMETEVVVIQDF